MPNPNYDPFAWKKSVIKCVAPVAAATIVAAAAAAAAAAAVDDDLEKPIQRAARYTPTHDDVVKKDLIKTSLEKAAQLQLDRDSAPKSETRSPVPLPPKGYPTPCPPPRALPRAHWHFRRRYVLSKKLLGPLLGGEVCSRDTIPVERWQSLGAAACRALRAAARAEVT